MMTSSENLLCIEATSPSLAWIKVPKRLRELLGCWGSPKGAVFLLLHHRHSGWANCKCLPWGAAIVEQHRQITKNGLVLTSCPASCEKLQEDEVRRGFGGDQITPSSLLQILGHEASFSRSDRKRHGGVLHWTVRLLEVIKVKLRDLPPTSLSNERRCDRVLLCMENKKLSDVNFQPTKFINLVVQKPGWMQLLSICYESNFRLHLTQREFLSSCRFPSSWGRFLWGTSLI